MRGRASGVASRSTAHCIERVPRFGFLREIEERGDVRTAIKPHRWTWRSARCCWRCRTQAGAGRRQVPDAGRCRTPGRCRTQGRCRTLANGRPFECPTLPSIASRLAWQRRRAAWRRCRLAGWLASLAAGLFVPSSAAQPPTSTLTSACLALSSASGLAWPAGIASHSLTMSWRACFSAALSCSPAAISARWPSTRALRGP
jgi:hypothetical protein